LKGIALYNVASPQRLIDVAKLVYGTGVVDTLIVVKPTGMAAQVGIPEVSKLAYRRGKNLVILSTLQEINEVLGQVRLVFIVHGMSGIKYLDPSVLKEDVVVVVHGGEGAFTRGELSLGEPLTIQGFEDVHSPVADVALVLSIAMGGGRG